MKYDVHFAHPTPSRLSLHFIYPILFIGNTRVFRPNRHPAPSFYFLFFPALNSFQHAENIECIPINADIAGDQFIERSKKLFSYNSNHSLFNAHMHTYNTVFKLFIKSNNESLALLLNRYFLFLREFSARLFAVLFGMHLVLKLFCMSIFRIEHRTINSSHSDW